jgi:hypothetical protein
MLRVEVTELKSMLSLILEKISSKWLLQ